MSFNLYFAGFGCKEADPECMEKGALRLLSYHLDKPRVELWNEEDRNMKIYLAGNKPELTQEQENRLMSYHTIMERKAESGGEADFRYKNGFPIFLDSGAFSAHTQGAEIDVDEYINYINQRDDHLTCFAQLDTIPGKFGQHKTKHDMDEAAKKSWENYLYMVERVKSPKKLMPIYHQGEDFKYLDQILNYRSQVDYMGISPANDLSTKQKEYWIAECFKRIKKSKNPNIKTHAFGMTSLRLLEKFPFYSADSTSWLMTGRTGGIMTKFGTIVISDNQTNDPKHAIHLPKKFKKELEKYVESFGFTLTELKDEYKKRMLFNIRYLLDWADNYEYKPQKVTQNKLF